MARPSLLGLVVLVLIAGAGLYWFFASGPGNRVISPPGSPIAEFSGDGDATTDLFQVRGQWQVHWENTGERFSFAIKGDRDLGTIIDQEGQGNGVTTVVAAGTFQMDVTAEGPWEVRVTQGE